jgi:hypothetical protein
MSGTETDNVDQGANQQHAHEDVVKTFRLRPELSGVTRLSRKVLAGGAALALIIVSGAVLWALQDSKKRQQVP